MGDDVHQLRSAAMEAFDVCGFRKPIYTLTHTESLVMHTCIYERKAELDQIILGLKDAGVLEMIRQHPTFFQPLFLKSTTKKLCAGWHGFVVCLHHSQVSCFLRRGVFSEAGTNELQREQGTYVLVKAPLRVYYGIS